MRPPHTRLAATIIAALFVISACTSAATPAPAPAITSVPATSPASLTPATTEPEPSPPPPTEPPPTEPPPPPAPPAALLGDVSAIAAGQRHTCALTTGGGVKCWGDHWAYGSGTGLPIGSVLPVEISGLTSGAIAISAGAADTCALTSGGGVKCWGRNQVGELGNGTMTASSVPVDVTGLTSGVRAIAAGNGIWCALTIDGGVKCWGLNGYGQLGTGTTTDSLVPVDVLGLTSGVSAIAAGGEHTCAVISAGGVKCWGIGEGGIPPGNGSVPVDVPGLAGGISAISAGYGHTCVLTNAGGVKCWGENGGRLGNGTEPASRIPVDVSGLTSGISAISAGHQHTCAVMSDGGVKCWGSPWSGHLGNSTQFDSLVPVDVTGLASGVSAISAGYGHTCAVMSGGGVKCWGDNVGGQLGTGTFGPGSLVPVDVWGPADPLLNTVVVTVADRLRVRSEPRVSDDSIKKEPVLPLGTELLVLDGPVSASGYTWYKVRPVSFARLDRPRYGWVAMAGKDGEPWIEPVE